MICGLASCVFGQHGEVVSIKLHDPRPLNAAADKLEERFGIPINYEDARIETNDEIIDITDQVQSPRQRAANPNVRIRVPKGGEYAIDLPLSTAQPSQGHIQDLVVRLISHHEAKSLPGRFRVVQIASPYGSMLAIEPTAVRAAGGGWKSTPSVLSLPISFPATTRSGLETLTVIASAVERASGIKTVVGTVPLNAVAQSSMTLGASQQPANAVLVQFLQQLAGAQGLPNSPHIHFSYRFLFDPVDRLYVLNLQAVLLRSRVTPPDSGPEMQRRPAAGQVPPQFRKQ